MNSITDILIKTDRHLFPRKIKYLRMVTGNLDLKAPDRYVLELQAEVVELVDTLRSGRSGRKPVWVQIPPSAPVARRAPGALDTGGFRQSNRVAALQSARYIVLVPIRKFRMGNNKVSAREL